ncbi:MAG TPA: LD-carboxypeptidase [Thermoanaerobaculia bacterium]|nr:LD-carboxypeptidase [Thermoanaerobaculia bacterium]
MSTELTKPPRLKPGATIGVAALSGPVDADRLERGISRLRQKGYRVVEASNLRKRSGFLAGSDEERASGYRELLRDPVVDAIFFARGGYGSSRTISRLDPTEAVRHPKIHLGASDLTALFAFLYRHARLATFYGPMVAVEMGEGEDLDWESILSGAVPEMHRFADRDVVAPGTGEGPLIGGCLSLLASLCGTPEALAAAGAILFWEDIGEEAYRIDRLLTQLERSGTLENLQGMVIGSVLPGGREQTPEQVRQSLRDRLGGASFPVALNFPAGHLPGPRTLPLGTRVRLDLRDGGEISFLEAGVSVSR